MPPSSPRTAPTSSISAASRRGRASDPVDEEEELARVVPVIEGLDGLARRDLDRYAQGRGGARGRKAGAKILNDVSALTYDPESLQVAAETGLAVVLMHAQGEPKTMQDDPRYADVVLEVFDYLEARIEAARGGRHPARASPPIPASASARRWRTTWRCSRIPRLFHGLGVPLLLGASRKRFIEGVSPARPSRRPRARLQAAAIAAAAQGAQILRVHDVAATRQALAVWRASAFGIEN